MIGYKGFDKNFKCKDFQYEVGQTYKFDGELEICECGFHFCDMPLAVFEFYPPADSRFALVEAVGNIVNNDGDKHKFCTDELKIIKELTLDELIAAVPKENVAMNTGNYSAGTVSGKSSVALVTGRDSKAKGAIGCWLVLGEWNDNELADVQVFKVDGVNIKADTYYKLKDGHAVEAEDND